MIQETSLIINTIEDDKQPKTQPADQNIKLGKFGCASDVIETKIIAVCCKLLFSNYRIKLLHYSLKTDGDF